MEFHFVMEEYNRMKDWCRETQKPTPIDDFNLETWLSDPVSFSKFEQLVMDWSKAHPRPKYPRFIDIIDDMIRLANQPRWKNLPLKDLMMEEIPENVAEEYGILPLNMCGINKYCDEDLGSDWR